MWDKRKRACKGTRYSADSGVDSAADQGLDGKTVLATDSVSGSESVRTLSTMEEEEREGRPVDIAERDLSSELVSRGMNKIRRGSSRSLSRSRSDSSRRSNGSRRSESRRSHGSRRRE